MLGANSYGKSGIRLVQVWRHGDRHDVQDLTVSVRLEGDFGAAHLAGDNAAILPTDTMKNTVYALAGAPGRPVEPIEVFALRLARHFVETHAPVSRARVEIAERPWERIDAGGRLHGSAFRRPGGEERLAVAACAREKGVKAAIDAGLQDLLILKTSRSGFSGFARDRFTTLRDTDDRLLATALRAMWSYEGTEHSFVALRAGIRQTLLETFADHESRSVQHTLYAMGEAVLERHAEVVGIRLTMPNKHHLPVDLAPFGLPDENSLFVATEEPFGLIEATVMRRSET